MKLAEVNSPIALIPNAAELGPQIRRDIGRSRRRPLSKNGVSQSRSEYVYDHIVDCIRAGQLKPEAKLTQRALAAELNVSQGSVREAFERLEQQGWIQCRRNSGVSVRSFSDRDRDEIYWIREMIEASAIREVAEKITDAQLAELKSALDTLATASDKSDVEAFELADVHFHSLIVCFSGNRMLETYYDGIMRQIRTFLMVGVMIKVEFHWVERCEYLEPVSHEKIYDAIAARDPDLAEKLICKHISFGNEVIRMINRVRED